MGFFRMDDVVRYSERMLRLLDLLSSGFTEICVAPDTPEMPQSYRKPSPRFVLEMAVRHGLAQVCIWRICDSLSDVMAELNAGVNSFIIQLRLEQSLPAGATGYRSFEELWARLGAGAAQVAQ